MTLCAGSAPAAVAEDDLDQLLGGLMGGGGGGGGALDGDLLGAMAPSAAGTGLQTDRLNMLEASAAAGQQVSLCLH